MTGNLINLAREMAGSPKMSLTTPTSYATTATLYIQKQLTQGYAPEDDTVRIAWNTVVAALNDLASLPV